MGPRYFKSLEDGAWRGNMNLVQAYNSCVNCCWSHNCSSSETHTHTRSLPSIYPVSAWISPVMEPLLAL